MIEISKLDEDSKKREVVYTAAHGTKEYGRITSWNDRYVFVRYHTVVTPDGRRSHQVGATTAATSPECLEFTA